MRFLVFEIWSILHFFLQDIAEIWRKIIGGRIKPHWWSHIDSTPTIMLNQCVCVVMVCNWSFDRLVRRLQDRFFFHTFHKILRVMYFHTRLMHFLIFKYFCTWLKYYLFSQFQITGLLKSQQLIEKILMVNWN